MLSPVWQGVPDFPPPSRGSIRATLATLGPSRSRSTKGRRARRGLRCLDNSPSSPSRQARRHGAEDRTHNVHAGCIDCRTSAAHGISRPGFARLCPDRSGGPPFSAAIKWLHEFRALQEFGHHRPSGRSHAQCPRFQIVRLSISSTQNILVSSFAAIRLLEMLLVPVSTGTCSLSSPAQVWMLLARENLIWVNRRVICQAAIAHLNPLGRKTAKP